MRCIKLAELDISIGIKLGDVLHEHATRLAVADDLNSLNQQYLS